MSLIFKEFSQKIKKKKSGSIPLKKTQKNPNLQKTIQDSSAFSAGCGNLNNLPTYRPH